MATHGSAQHGHGHGHDAHDHGSHDHHGISVRTYVVVFAWLMLLLIITLAAAAVDLKAWNLPIAMIIALIKVALIVTFFMHLKISTNLVRLFALGAAFWLVIMFVMTLSDYATRTWFPGAAG